MLRHREIWRDPRRTLGRLRSFFQRRRFARSAGKTYSDLLRAVRSLPFARRQLGRAARIARGSRGEGNRGVCAERSWCDCGAAGSDATRFGTNLRADRRQHLSRRFAPGTTLLYATGAGLGALSHADRRTVSVRGRSASGRRSDRRARTQRRVPGFARLEERTTAGDRSVNRALRDSVLNEIISRITYANKKERDSRTSERRPRAGRRRLFAGVRKARMGPRRSVHS